MTRVGHFRGLVSTGVRSQHVGDAVLVHEPSDKNGVPFTKLVATYYCNLLTFAEDFVALALNLAMPPCSQSWTVGETDREDLSKYKYGIGAPTCRRRIRRTPAERPRSYAVIRCPPASTCRASSTQ